MKRELTNQELLDRYVHSVKTMLPPEKMEDIAAEIRSNLESLAEDRAAGLGRDLRPAEMSAMLKERGHPALVAIPYRDPRRRGLISPVLFPLYWFTVRAAFAVWVTIRVIIAVFVFQGDTPAGQILWTLGRDILLAAFFIASGLLWIFALWEYLEFKYRFSERWEPESLPPVPAPVRQPQPRPRPAREMIRGVAWLTFWAMALFVPELSWIWGGRGVFVPSDTLSAMRLPFLLLAIAGTCQNWLKFTRFAAAEWRRLLRIALIVTGWGMTYLLLRAGDVLVAGPNWDPTEAKPLATMTQMTAGVLVLVCVFGGLGVLQDLRFLLRRGARDRQTADSTS